MNSIYENALEALKSPSVIRRTGDIIEMIRHVSFFKEFKNEMTDYEYRECALHLTLKEYSAGDEVVRYGDRADNFYIILQGDLTILVTDDEGIREVSTLHTGGSFGEMGLTQNKPRAATIVCSTVCWLAMLNKANYIRLFDTLVNKKQRNLIYFIKNNPFFCNLTNIAALRLSYFFTEKEVVRHSVLFKEQGKAEQLYFVKKGSFNLSRVIREPQETASSKLFSLRKTVKKHNFEFAIVSTGYLLGGDDILNEHYTSTCQCVSQRGTVFCVPKKEVLLKIRLEETGNFIKVLQQRSLIREQRNRDVVRKKFASIDFSAMKRMSTELSAKKIGMGPPGDNKPCCEQRPRSSFRQPRSSIHQILDYYKTNIRRNLNSRKIEPQRIHAETPAKRTPFHRPKYYSIGNSSRGTQCGIYRASSKNERKLHSMLNFR